MQWRWQVEAGCLCDGQVALHPWHAALLLRPFNFETLATYVFNYASDEHLELAALPAILLILVGLVPLILVNRSLEQK